MEKKLRNASGLYLFCLIDPLWYTWFITSLAFSITPPQKQIATMYMYISFYVVFLLLDSA